jgi:peptide/nickel transport system permease protein
MTIAQETRYVDPPKPRGISQWRVVRFARDWPIVPGFIIIVMLVSAIFAPLIANHDPTAGNINRRAIPPAWLDGGSTKFLLGTDALGRDMFSRVVYGTRVSLSVAGIVLVGGAIGGTFLGLISGWFGGMLDEVLMRIVDFMLATPFILVALVVVIVFGKSMPLLIVLLIIFSWDSFARQIRGESLGLKNLDYVVLSRISGASNARILYRHLLPGVMNTVMVMVSLRVGALIITLSTLTYLGVGVPPPTPAWGLMVADGRDYINSYWWMTIFPGVAIFATVLAFNFLGDWMRDHFDPRLRQQV